MTFSSYLSFASLYEIEQRQALHSRAIASDRGVLRRDSSVSVPSPSSPTCNKAQYSPDTVYYPVVTVIELFDFELVLSSCPLPQ